VTSLLGNEMIGNMPDNFAAVGRGYAHLAPI
jgi:hypothetical protein